MKIIPGPLFEKMRSLNTSLVWCWKITRFDGVTYRFTTNSRDVPIGPEVYKAESAILPTAIQGSNTMSVSNLNATIILSDDDISEADLAAGMFDDAAVEVFRVDPTDTSLGTIPGGRGMLGETMWTGVRAEVEFRALSDLLQGPTLRQYGVECDWILGDPDTCRVDLGPFTVAGTVTQGGAADTFTDTGRTEPTGDFDYGWVTFTSGPNAIGRDQQVKRFDGGLFQLVQPLPYVISPGETYTAVRGCDQTVDTCVAKFDNLDNYGGFPFLAGTDALVRTPIAAG